MARNYLNCTLRFSLTLLVSLLLFGVASFAQASTAQAADTVTSGYGAGVNPTGNPIGGGVGYSKIIAQSAAKYVVSTKSQLLTALDDATSGQIVYVADSAQIDLTGVKNLAVPAGVTLASGRGQNGSSGGLIYNNDRASSRYPEFIKLGTDARVTGLRVRGPDGAVGTSSSGYLYSGLNADGVDSVEIDNCEIYNWPQSGVGFYQASTGWVHHNYIHNCQRTGFGYGVAVSGASVLIEANLFDYNRHSIMGERGYPVSSYEARYNIFETGCTTGQSCDMHGGNDISDKTVPAGGTISIHHNTFKAIWNAVNIRGIPATGAKVYNNWALDDPADWSPSDVFMQSLDNLPGHTPYERMQVYDNWYGTSTPPSSNPGSVSTSNRPPATPSAPSGTQEGTTATRYMYWAMTTDPDGDTLWYTFDWGDGSGSTTILKNSGTTGSATHSWTRSGEYAVRVRSTDSEGAISSWSPAMTVNVL